LAKHYDTFIPYLTIYYFLYFSKLNDDFTTTNPPLYQYFMKAVSSISFQTSLCLFTDHYYCCCYYYYDAITFIKYST